MGGGKKTERKRIGDFGIVPGVMRTGSKNRITDVPGALVGHKTVRNGDNKIGVTVIVPGPGNVLEREFIAARYVYNGFGKTCSLVQVEGLETLGTPITLTNTPNVGLAANILVECTIRQCEEGQVEVIPVSPVVGECNDCRINRIQHKTVPIEDVMKASSGASEDFKEGDMGAGTGTVCYSPEGGIESASRVMRVGGVGYTLGALVQSNSGATEDLIIDDVRISQRILEEEERRGKMAITEQDQGSTMTIIAMDLPVNDRQLKRIIRRAGMGIVKTGAYTEHGSGKIMIGFTTAGRLQGKDSSEIMTSTRIKEDLISMIFKAAAEAANEAILNSMIAAGCTGGLVGKVCYSLLELLPQILKH